MNLGDKYIAEIYEITPIGARIQCGKWKFLLSEDILEQLEKYEEPKAEQNACSICELYIKGETCEQRDTCPVAALQSKYWALLRQNKQLRSEIQQIQDMLTADFKKQSKAIKDRLSYFKDIV